MGIHNIQNKLQASGAFTTSFSGFKGPEGLCFGFGKTVGNGIEGWAPGALFIDTDSTTVKYNAGTKTTASWSSIVAAGQTLDLAFTGGAGITGAVSSATAVTIGNGTDDISLYYNAANDVRIGTNSDAALTIIPAGNLTLAPVGGTTAVTGALTVSTTLNVTGTTTLAGLSITGTLTLNSLAAATANTALSLDGNGSGGVKLGETSTGNVAIYRNTTLAASRSLTLAGVDGSTILAMTAGDLVLSEGAINITDTDNAAALTIANDTITTAALVTFASSSLTTGKGLSITADAVTSGSLLYLESSAALFVGKYIQCYDGAADDFSVGLYGATIIAGNAAGTDALTITAGDIGITAGYIDLDNGKIEVDTTGDLTNYFKRNRTGANTSAVVVIEATHTGEQKPALTVTGSMTGAYDAMTLTYAGTADALKITTSDVAGTGLELICAASTTDSMLKVDGSTGNWIGATNVGMVNLVCDGALAHANASCLYIAYSGTGAATGLGTSIRVVDTGATATSYAVYISSATSEALYVAVGIAKFAESVTLDTGLTMTTSGAILSEDATNTYWNAGAANETFNFGHSTATDVLFHGTDATIDMLWDSSLDALNIGVAAAVARGTTSGKGVINLFNASVAPVGTLANGISLYAEGGVLKVNDAAGNASTLSPHDEDNRWVFDSKNEVSGQSFRVDMQKLIVRLASKFPEDFAELVKESGY
jgi:hypothetical protein